MALCHSCLHWRQKLMFFPLTSSKLPLGILQFAWNPNPLKLKRYESANRLSLLMKRLAIRPTSDRLLILWCGTFLMCHDPVTCGSCLISTLNLTLLFKAWWKIGRIGYAQTTTVLTDCEMTWHFTPQVYVSIVGLQSTLWHLSDIIMKKAS